MSVIRMSDLDLNGKRVLIREDLNVPVKNGKVTSDARLKAAIPTIELALSKGAKVMVMSHLGRPEEGVYDAESSLQPVVDYLAQALAAPVRLAADYLSGINIADGEVVVFENVRFNKGEGKNDDALAQQLAALCDVFVM
ncbi:MAG: phosphoglycerate kinase, partial [Gammaproteobacteria bacterium]|nr:phosphoglycerate kinase [Gammaproteobacteria bacterium]